MTCLRGASARSPTRGTLRVVHNGSSSAEVRKGDLSSYRLQRAAKD